VDEVKTCKTREDCMLVVWKCACEGRGEGRKGGGREGGRERGSEGRREEGRRRKKRESSWMR